jgi:DNA-binding response OmpR family regulator
MPIRVLVAEPEDLLLEIYLLFFAAEGFEVATCNGDDCIKQLHDWQPHVMVLEPEILDGLGERILTEVGHVPVIVLTRRAPSPTVQERCECHIKPFRMSALADAIRAAVMPTGDRL